MKNLLASIAFAATAAAKLVTLSPPNSTGTDIAIVWIQGAMCDNEAYTEIAETVQAQGATKGQRIWVGIPSFVSGSPDPVTIVGKVSDTVDALRQLGFQGDNIVMAGHSLGGVMSQGYTKTHGDTIKAQVLMGSVLTRDNRSIASDGHTVFDYDVPTLSITGSKDGLMRMSRAAESFWHSNINVTKAQANKYPTVAFEGVSHAQFMSGRPPLNVRDKDLVPDVSAQEAYDLTATAFTQFLDQVILGHAPSIDTKASQQVLDGML